MRCVVTLFTCLENLRAAVSRGAVKRVSQNGIDFYMFPNLKVGTSQDVSQSIEGSRSKKVSDDAMAALGTLVDETSWAIDSDATASEANLVLEDGVKDIAGERMLLSEEVVKLDKTIKLCEKAADVLERVENKSSAVQESHSLNQQMTLIPNGNQS